MYLKVNVKECETHIFVEVEVPGIPKRNISMEIEPMSIEIRAFITVEKNSHNGLELTYIRKERTSGKFKRKISLPCKININDAKADHLEGVLYIELVKPNDISNTGKRQLKLY